MASIIFLALPKSNLSNPFRLDEKHFNEDLEFDEGFSWNQPEYQLPLRVSYDIAVQDDHHGAILIALFSRSMTSPKPNLGSIDLDAISWQMSTQSSQQLIRTKWLFEVPDQDLHNFSVQLCVIYTVETILTDSEVTVNYNGEEVARAYLKIGDIPDVGHIGFGVVGRKLDKPAII